MTSYVPFNEFLTVAFNDLDKYVHNTDMTYMKILEEIEKTVVNERINKLDRPARKYSELEIKIICNSIHQLVSLPIQLELISEVNPFSFIMAIHNVMKHLALSIQQASH